MITLNSDNNILERTVTCVLYVNDTKMTEKPLQNDKCRLSVWQGFSDQYVRGLLDRTVNAMSLQ